MAPRASALLGLVSALIALGCGGGGDETTGEEAVRDCLAQAGLEIEAVGPGTGAAVPLGNATPDFRAVADGLAVDVMVERDDQRAQRTAVDLRAALSTLGAADADLRVLEGANVVAVFDGEPSTAQRDAVAGCLD